MKKIIYFSMITTLMLFLASCSAPQSESPSAKTLSDDQLVLAILVNFLESLQNSNYAEAAQLFGGTYETMIDQNPNVDPNNHAVLWQNACTLNGMQCLQVKSASLDKKVSDTEFVFKVDFLNDDRTLFELGPCCGEDETNFSPQSVFYFTVIKVNNNKFVVMDTPPYAP